MTHRPNAWSWLQSARGRAVVRNNHMRKARGLKANHLKYGNDPVAVGDLIRYHVRAAREAHREWRRYRRLAKA